jgi:hypothetical protein
MRFSEGTFAIVIVLMSFEFRLGNHFDSPAAPDRAYVPRIIKSKRQLEIEFWEMGWRAGQRGE